MKHPPNTADFRHGVLPEWRYLPRWVNTLMARLTGITAFEKIVAALDWEADAVSFARRGLEELGVRYSLADEELRRVPAGGGVVIVANHPYGGIDGLVGIAALGERRPDLRVLANTALTKLDPLRGTIIPVDPFGRRKLANAAGARAALRHLAAGGALLLFPSGEVAHLRLGRLAVVDPPWTEAAARLIRLAAVPVVPMHLSGRNSARFQLLGLLHPLLRTVLLPRELLNKRGTTVRLRVGLPIRARRLARCDGSSALNAHLRATVQLLSRSALPAEPAAGAATPGHDGLPAPGAPQPLVEPIDPTRLAAEVAGLPATALVASGNEMAVYCVSAGQIPLALQEIGRLRELTFRKVGEGTGRATDLDAYDDYYEHLFIWHPASRRIIGAYRVGRVDEIRRARGVAGLYLASLFEFNDLFFALLGPALELGRSFVHVDYQRSFAPLYLLWKGLSEYIGRHPRYAKLIGAASISNRYDPASRALMVAALRAWRRELLLGSLVRARQPFQAGLSLRSLCGEVQFGSDVESLSSLIEDREPDGKGLPVLLRHYLRLGARSIGFNIDSNFAYSLDCLIVLDVRRVPGETLAKYMSAQALQSFAAYWHLDDLTQGNAAARD
jgi:putative hemolysin